MVQPRSKTIVIVAARARNGVIGNKNEIPWHVPSDFVHFKKMTVKHTLLMGRTTFESIGRPLPDRTTIVLTRDRHWTHPGVEVAHDLQGGIDAAENFSGQLIVAGGSHIYAEMLPHAQLQVISEIDATPLGDAYYPEWDPSEWISSPIEDHGEFSVTRWHRKSGPLREFEFELSSEAARAWWNTDWTSRLAEAVENQRVKSSRTGLVDWARIHAAAMRVIIEAAEDQLQPASSRRTRSSPDNRRLVRLGEHVSFQDVKEIQGALFHWSQYVAPRGPRTELH